MYEQIKDIMDRTRKIPYPEVVNIYPNERYADMLYNDFAGELGEISAITQYIYEHICLAENKELSDILKSIAIMEMHHLDILGGVLKKLGKSPKFINSEGKEWTTKNLKYNIEDFQEMMKHNIYTEEVAIKQYRRAMQFTNNRSLRKLFERIIIDEKMHKEVFDKIMKEAR